MMDCTFHAFDMIDGQCFEDWVELMLIPAIAAKYPLGGVTVVMDNARWVARGSVGFSHSPVAPALSFQILASISRSLSSPDFDHLAVAYPPSTHLPPPSTRVYSFHRRLPLLALFNAANVDIALRFLPAYSPEYNPIETAFAWIKYKLRSTPDQSAADLIAATLAAIDAVRHTGHSARWIKFSGYVINA